jgi:hypothetical protein
MYIFFTKFCLANLKGRDHLEDLGVDGKIILEWLFVFQKLY